MTTRSHSQLLAVPAALLLSAALAACGNSSASTTSSSSPAVSALPATGKIVRVTLANYSVKLAGGNHLSPGTYTFVVTNTSGGTGHNLTISGPGVANRATPTFSSGTKRLTVTLKTGMYTFFCSIHKALGMTTAVTVGSGSGSGGSSGGSTSTGGSSSSGGSWS
ncbi:MAG: plastocyanin/azurin family copper-binding protein [Gaiellales bacterium]